MYYRKFVVEHKFGFNTSTFANFCLGQVLDGLLMLLRNAVYTLIATAVMYYGSTNLPEYLYFFLILLVTNLLVLIDCFGVS
jgi:Na+/H+-dicarboxylate symporter